MPIGGNISGGGGGGGGEESSWEEQYFVDWSAESAHDWDANASPFDIQGAAWAGAFMANGSKCEIVPASGLELSPDASAATAWYSSQDCPSLYAKISDWSGNAGIFDSVTNLQAIAVQCLITGNPIQDNNGYGITLTGAGGFGASIERLYDSSVWGSGSHSGYRVSSAAPGFSWNAINSAEDGNEYQLFEIVMFPGGLCVCSVRDEASFVDPLGSSEFQKQLASNGYLGNAEASNSWLPANVYVQFLAYNGATNTHTATFKNLRVLSLGV